MLKRLILSFLFFSLVLSCNRVFAFWIWTPETNRWLNPKAAPKATPKEQFDYAMGFFNEKNYDRAIAEFSRLILHYSKSEFTSPSQYYLGRCYEDRENYYEAFLNYQKVIDLYPYSDRVEEIIERQYRIGNIFQSGQRVKSMGVKLFPAKDKAIEVYQKVVQNAPYGKYAENAQYRLGICYKELGDYASAILAFKKLTDDYPQGELVEEARYQMAACAIASQPKPDYDRETTVEARKEFEDYVSQHPESDISQGGISLLGKMKDKEAESSFKIARFYEKQKKYESAVVYYQEVIEKYPESSWASRALERIAIIKGK
jgi:outer membrane protein assembly factor BamD